ncbi:MAG: aldo/keto reductase [Christensenellales bacterium]|jgi:aryl-alcohol dehydrogenase-like predicted oxidoreductase
MRKIPLKGLRTEAFPIALGSAAFGMTMDEENAFRILDCYAQMGGNLIDTARIYGDIPSGKTGQSEEIIGRWLRKNGCRRDTILATKGGHPRIETMHIGRLDEKNLQSDLSESLEALQTDCVDIYYLHRDDATLAVSEIMEVLHGFVKRGMVKALGASNWSAGRIREANAYAESHGLTPFSANEPQWSLARMTMVEDPTLKQMDGAMLSLHEETKMLCMPFTPQAKGFFAKLHELGEEGLPEKAKRRYLSEENLARYRVLREICERRDLSVGAGAIAYLTSRDFPVCPVCGVSSVSQCRALLESAEAKMEKEDIERLDAIR